jgi:uncharacterized protein
MFPFLPFLIVLALSGALVMIGIGGSSVMIPIFMQLGIDAYNARLAGLAIVAVSTGLSSYVYIKQKLIKREDFSEVVFILLGMLIAIPIGVNLSLILSDKIILGSFSLILFISAFSILDPKKHLIKAGLLADEGIGFFEGIGSSVLGATALRSLTGGSAGIVNGTLGIGGGIFMVPALILTGSKPRKAAVLSVVCMALGSLFSFFNHIILGTPDYTLIGSVAVAAAISSYFGSKCFCDGGVSNSAIRRAFPILLIAFAIKLAIDFFSL